MAQAHSTRLPSVVKASETPRLKSTKHWGILSTSLTPRVPSSAADLTARCWVICREMAATIASYCGVSVEIVACKLPSFCLLCHLV